MSNFSLTGYTPRSVQDIRSVINARMKAVFGEDFDVTTSSPDGQIIGVVAQEIWEIEQECFALFQSLSPILASGVSLDYAVSYNDLKRIVDRPCRVLLTLGGTTGTVIPKGSMVSTSDASLTKLYFKTDIQVTLPATVMATCTQKGDFNVNTGEVTKIESLITGWTTVTNLEDGMRGVPYESDGQLRARHLNAIEAQGRQSTGSVLAALTRLGVEHLTIVENATDETVDGVPKNSFEVIIKGGEPNQIAAIINAERPLGIRTHGTTNIPILDSTGTLRDIKFTRPTEQPIEISVDITKLVGASNDVEAQIKANLIKHIASIGVGKPVEWAALFAPISLIPNIRILQVRVAKQGESLGTASIPVSARKYAETASSLITINIT